MCCVVPILFGWFLRVPSLHVLVFIWKTFSFDLYIAGIPLLAFGLTVKLSPCPWTDSCMSVGIPNAIWLTATRSGYLVKMWPGCIYPSNGGQTLKISLD